MFRSATFKLTVSYMGIILLISLAFSIVVFNLATRQLELGLAHQSQRFVNEFPAFSNNQFFRQRSELKEGRREIITNLIVFNGFVFVCAGFASYALARRTLEPIEAAHLQQKRFTADVSHELRTPLTALRMESEIALMDESASKPDLRAALSSNVEEAEKMQQLINNLLRLTRLESDELQAGFSAVPLQAILDAAVKQTASAAKAKHVQVHSAKSALRVQGDESSLVQLLVILLDNAIKYSPEKSDVQVHVKRADGQATIEISDKGSGIEPDALAHVFERFYRADKARGSGHTQGYGLGLSIAKHIADTHQGSVTLKSRVNHGTTAIVHIPLADTSDA